jgi:D-alanine transfer protein
MKSPHLAAAFAALLLSGVLLWAGKTAAVALEDRYIHTLSPELSPQAVHGSAMLQTALRQPDLLPVIGSSELLWKSTPYRCIEFFSSYPTGFDVFVDAQSAATPILYAQQLAGAGAALRGKKIVVMITPLVFYHPQVRPEVYAGDFSHLHALEMAYSPLLSFELKGMAARRMLQYPATLEKDPLLRFALQRLADGSLPSRLLYEAVQPLGRLETLAVSLQDHWEVVNAILQQPGLDPQVNHHPQTPDWNALKLQALHEQSQLTTSNPYGVENILWYQTYQEDAAQHPSPGSWDTDFMRHLQVTQEWTDLDIMLRTLKELGAQPLILSLPAKGQLMDALGVSRQARQQYYDRVRATVAAYGFPLLDYEEFDEDTYFVIDMLSHTSRTGWVYVDQTLDAYFHNTLR